MSERRRKAKAKVQPAPLNIQQAAAEEKSDKSREVRNARRNSFGSYLLDVSKFVLTGVVITSLFDDIGEKVLIYVLSIIIVASTLLLGLRLINKCNSYGSLYSYCGFYHSLHYFPRMDLYSTWKAVDASK
jgi:hypothetical protein